VIRPLVFKELREHRWVLLMLWIAGGLALLGLSKVAKDEGSPLVAYRTMVWVFGVLSALILANRLVVREFSGRTQLFLETLPVSRVQIIAVKWLTGAVLLGIPMTITFAIVLHAAAEKSLLTARFIDLIAIRSASFLLFAYALAFFIGLTGRYRYVLWGALVLTAFAMDSLTQTPVAQLAPLHVGASSMVFERFELPMTDLVITWLATAFLVAATFSLSLAAEGSLVVALSQRMSPREKVAVTVSVLAILSLVGQMEARKPKPAFKLHDAVIGGSATAPVAIGETDEVSDDAAKTLADRLSADLQGLRTYLSLTVIPSVTVLPEESIDADIFMRATLPNSDGVVLRAALGAERFNEDAFRTYSLEEVLDWFSHSRARQEDRLWLLDGFTQWWSTRGDSARQQQLRLRAAAAWQVLHGEGATIQDELHHWLVAREQLGECLSDGLAGRESVSGFDEGAIRHPLAGRRPCAVSRGIRQSCLVAIRRAAAAGVCRSPAGRARTRANAVGRPAKVDRSFAPEILGCLHGWASLRSSLWLGSGRHQGRGVRGTLRRDWPMGNGIGSRKSCADRRQPSRRIA
jgi:hypothetical protein